MHQQTRMSQYTLCAEIPTGHVWDMIWFDLFNEDRPIAESYSGEIWKNGAELLQTGPPWWGI